VATPRLARVSAEHDLNQVRGIVLGALSGHRARVWLFGSHARGEAVRGSDIDVAILALEPLPEGLLEETRQALENSEVLLPVDLVDLSSAEPGLREHVEREGIPWRS
jgi:predicted nucleotidyltransferase